MGLLDGVVATTPGWIDRTEVVEVVFDPRTIDYAALVKAAAERDCTSKVFTRTDEQQETAAELVAERALRSDVAVRIDDDKFYLSRTPLKYVPMTSLQATRVNASVGEQENPGDLLAPAQRALLVAIRAHPDAGWEVVIGKGLREAWDGALARMAALEAAGGTNAE